MSIAVERIEIDRGTDRQPACCAGGPGTQQWRETSFSAQLARFFDPCTDCFPGGEVTVPFVVRSRHYPSVLHRPRDRDAVATETGIADGGTADQPFVNSEPISINTVTEFQAGEGVVWSNRSTPLVVEQPTTDPAGTLILSGTTDTAYTLQSRPDMGVPYAIYPSYGLVEEVFRLKRAATNSSPTPSGMV